MKTVANSAAIKRDENDSAQNPHKGQALKPSRRTHLLHIGIVVIACVAIYWRVFFLGYTLLDVSTLNNQLPWGYHAGKSDYPYDRRDPTDMYVTREYFVVQAYHEHELPLWNPYTMSGLPMYADGVTHIFSPFLLFYTFLDVPLGYSIARITELMLAAVFMYLFLVGIGVGPRGALFGSLVLELSSHAMMHVTGLGWWGGLLWLPLILLFVDRAIHRRSYKNAATAGLLFAAQFYCSFTANQIYYLGAILLYYLFFGFLEHRRSAGAPRLASWSRTAAMAAVTVLIGFALSATQWVPVFQLLGDSNRLIIGSQLSYIYLPPWYAGTLIFPNLFGSTYDPHALTLFAGINVSHDHVMYLGIEGLFSLAFCFYFLWKKRAERIINASLPSKIAAGDGSANDELPGGRDRLNYFLLLGAIALLLMMTAPIYVHITRFIPFLHSIRVVVRAGVLFIIAAAAVSAIGIDLLMKSDRDLIGSFSRFTRKCGYVIFALVILSIGVAYTLKALGFQEPYEKKGKLAFIHKSAGLLSMQFTPPDAGILLPLLLLVVAVILMWALSASKVDKGVFFALFVVLLFADTAWNGLYFDRSFERTGVYRRTEITDFLKSLPAGRVLPEPSDIDLNRRIFDFEGRAKIISPPNTLLPYQISTITGKDQLFPKWYQRYATLVEPQPNMSHVVFDEDSSPFFDLLNVRYVMTHASGPAPPGMKLLKTGEGVSVYENPNAMPRAFFPSRVEPAPDQDSAYRMMKSIDPVRTAVIEGRPGSNQALRGGECSGAAELTESSRNSLTITTDSSTGGWLVVSDTYYPGWSAYVDGALTEIFPADVTMRAVKVPAGSHKVKFVFRPESLKVSGYVSLCGAAIVLLAFAAAGIRSVRETAAASDRVPGN